METLTPSSLAKSAIIQVLSTRPARFKLVVGLLEMDLDTTVYRVAKRRLNGILVKGWDAVKTARY
jgi:hypothetical protein